LDDTLSLLVFEEVGNFCLMSILAVVAMAKKITYKKRKKADCTTDY
jgi:hypothetical protein